MMRLNVLIFLLWSTLVHPAAAKPYLYGAMGDSISAASLSITRLMNEGSDGEAPPDGIPVRYKLNPLRLYQNKSLLSWASGRLVNSHHERLRRFLGKDLVVLNVATPDAKAHSIPKQARQLLRALESGMYAEMVYVTLLIGANDTCVNTPNEQMKTDLLAAMETLSRVKQQDTIRILVAPVPAIPELGSPLIRQARTVGGMTCENFRKRVLHVCKRVSLWETDEEYRQKLVMVEEKNEVLRDVVRESRKKFPNLDIIFAAEEVPNLTLSFTPAMLSADCFHPGKRGQEWISQTLWNAQPWFK
jgi:lysophospholipase L1-like esterase